MKKIVALTFIVFCFSACKKNSTEWIDAVVVQQGCAPGSWVVQLNHPDRKKHPFLCEPTQAMLSSASSHCGNSAVILDMPLALAQAGTAVRFSVWEDEGLLCFSSTLAPHHLKVGDIRAQ